MVVVVVVLLLLVVVAVDEIWLLQVRLVCEGREKALDMLLAGAAAQ